MLGHAVACQPAPMLAMRPIGLRLRHGVDALGNAIGSSLASGDNYSRWGTDDTETQRLLARYPTPAPDLPSVDFETRPPLPDINERPLPEIGDVPSLRPEDRLVRLPRVVVTGSRANAASGLTSETAAEIGGISGREEGLALAGRYLDYSRQLRGHAVNAGSSAIAKTYNSMADGYAAASREANRVSGQFTTYSSLPRPFTNPEPFGGGANWSMYGANAAGVEMSFRQGTPEGVDRLVPLLATAPVTVPLLFTGWGFAGAVTLGGGTAGYQYFSSGNVNTYDVLDAGSFGAALPSLATGAYSLTTRAWSALSFSEAASTSRLVGAGSAESVGTQAAARERGTFIFRGDGRPPEVVFAEGLQPRGTNQDLYRYALENEPSVFVPTSKSPTVAREFAEMQGGGYVYTIRGQANGIDVNAALGSRSPFPTELEIAVPGGIRSADILGARQVSADGKFVGPFLKNGQWVWR